MLLMFHGNFIPIFNSRLVLTNEFSHTDERIRVILPIELTVCSFCALIIKMIRLQNNNYN